MLINLTVHYAYGSWDITRNKFWNKFFKLGVDILMSYVFLTHNSMCATQKIWMGKNRNWLVTRHRIWIDKRGGQLTSVMACEREKIIRYTGNWKILWKQFWQIFDIKKYFKTQVLNSFLYLKKICGLDIFRKMFLETVNFMWKVVHCVHVRIYFPNGCIILQALFSQTPAVLFVWFC